MKTLPYRITFITRLFCRFYYKRLSIHGTPSTTPTLYLASHRNGATDGYVFLQVLGNTPSLISIQLLRHRYLRFFFDGIPVVRPKDRQRYGISADSVPSPIYSAIEQIRQGGSLIIYPEGTSAWQHQPLPYQSGMAVIAAKLKAAGIPFNVQALGSFYSKPDGFRSRVSIILGETFTPQSNNIPDLQTELSAALNAVSVNCHDTEHFNHVQATAWQAAQSGEDYGKAFLRAQYAPENSLLKILPPANRNHWAKYLFYLGFPFVVLAAQLTTRYADARNNITFFRLLGGGAGLLLHAILWLILFCYAPLIASLWLIAGIIGWYDYPEPLPLPIKQGN
ncbi:MAG: 1-acyl-sn-glycerol-3-phosphate acyltransferase [Cardiobacteriaceae bacterium]|nr:1-acyl-sn-glycerol-3-phosphate acyltransferase [Cardiobacteriaceae bacterium]